MGRTSATSGSLLDGSVRIDDGDEKCYPAADKKISSTSANPVVDDAIQVRDEENSIKSDSAKEFLVKYRGNTYEISGFFEKHPGGRQSLSFYRGLPLDRLLKEIPHSDAAFHLLEEFLVDNKRKYDDIENLINWEEPLLGQVGNLADRYWEWVNLPVNRSIRLFKSNILENLTITPWYLVPTVWIPISLYFLFSGFATRNSRNVQISLPGVALALFFGLLLWTLMEYVMHRNLFHMKPPAENKTLITMHFLLHGLHHKAPFDDQRLLFPPAAAVLIAAVFYKLYDAVLPEAIVDFVAAGTMTGYLCYDLMHYYLHYGRPEAESYLYVMKRYHNHHHFSHHDHGFGISSRLWDFAFGSLIRLKQLKKAIVW